jgi:hypothetical protein
MGIAALVTWLVTAAGGFYMLSKWIAKGGVRNPGSSHFPPPVIFGHFGLAAAGLVIWIIYLVTDSEGLAWVAFVLLLPVAALGLVMLTRWLPTYRSRSAVTAGRGSAGAAADDPPEAHFPIGVVGGHGLFAVVTLILVFLTAVGVGD